LRGREGVRDNTGKDRINEFQGGDRLGKRGYAYPLAAGRWAWDQRKRCSARLKNKRRFNHYEGDGRLSGIEYRTWGMAADASGSEV